MKMRGGQPPLPLSSWVKKYEEYVGKFILDPEEQLWWRPDKGFFTWVIDWNKKRVLVPKMIGDGRHMRKIIYDIMVEARRYGINTLVCCTREKRMANIYLKLLGGKETEEKIFSPVTGENDPLYQIVVTLDDTKWKNGGIVHGREKV